MHVLVCSVPVCVRACVCTAYLWMLLSLSLSLSLSLHAAVAFAVAAAVVAGGRGSVRVCEYKCAGPACACVSVGRAGGVGGEGCYTQT